MPNCSRLILLDAESADALLAFRDEDLLPHVPEGLAPLPPLRLSDFDATP